MGTCRQEFFLCDSFLFTSLIEEKKKLVPPSSKNTENIEIFKTLSLCTPSTVQTIIIDHSCIKLPLCHDRLCPRYCFEKANLPKSLQAVGCVVGIQTAKTNIKHIKLVTREHSLNLRHKMKSYTGINIQCSIRLRSCSPRKKKEKEIK